MKYYIPYLSERSEIERHEFDLLSDALQFAKENGFNKVRDTLGGEYFPPESAPEPKSTCDCLEIFCKEKAAEHGRECSVKIPYQSAFDNNVYAIQYTACVLIENKKHQHLEFTRNFITPANFCPFCGTKYS